MVIASGTRVLLGYIEEVTRGTTPGSPTLKTLRATQRAPNLEKDLLESAEVRTTRQRSDVRHGFNRVAGTYGFQLSMQDYDDIWRHTLGGTWAAVTTGSISMSVDGTAEKFVRATGSFITDGFRPGDLITSTGFTGGNNGLFLATAVTALEITVSGNLTTEVAAGTRTLAIVNRLDVGTNLKTMTLERQFPDITQYQPFRGVCVNQLQCNITPEAIANASVTLLGMSGGLMAGSSVAASPPTAAAGTSPFAAFDGALYVGGTLVAIATSLTFTINNQRTLQGVIGSKFSPDVFEGTVIITGEMSIMLTDSTFFNNYFNETELSLWLKLNDPNGTDFQNFVFPRIKFTGANMDPAQTGPVIQNIPFTALENTTYGSSMSIQRTNA